MKNKALYILCIFFVGFFTSTNAQDLLKKLEGEFPDNPQYVLATFKTTRISIGHSVETRKKGILEISAFNRFWNLPNVRTQRFLADRTNSRFSLEYGVSDRLTFGLGTSTLEKSSDGFFKYRLIRQRSDNKSTPLSITLFQGVSYNTQETSGFDLSDRLAYTTQVLIGKKFNPKFSAQITPTFIHRSHLVFSDDPHNQFAVGFGLRHKIGGHVSLVSEYYYVANPIKTVQTFNAFALGVNWELSDVLLQFSMTNTKSAVENVFITKTPNNFSFNDGNFHFGFGATFVLHLRKNKLN